MGAAVAAAGLGTDLPTWLEMVDQLDLYYNSRNVRGDLESAWKPVLVPRLVKAGLEYRNPEPTTGLKLQAGRSTVQITIRRPGEDGRMIYRRVTSTPGRTNEADIPLEIDVVAHPGQGFALVKIHSKETGVFDSHLDWQKMEPCGEPKPPLLGYIPVAAEIRADAELWRRAEADLAGLALALEGNQPPEDVEFLARDANRKICRLTAIRTDLSNTASPSSDSLRYLIRALDRNGHPPTKAGEPLMARLRRAGVHWLVTHRRHSGGAKWLVRHFGWWHLGCPDVLRTETVTRLTSTPALCSAIDLHLAGLALQTPAHLAAFFRAYLEVMPQCNSPNAWLRAFRNLIKFNEHALQAVTPIVAERLYAATLARLIWAFENSRPQIAQNCVEALLYCLKRRRYEETFVGPGSGLYRRTIELLEEWAQSGFRFKTKLNEMRLTFTRFLRTEGNLQDLATLMAEEDEESEE